MGFQRNSKQNPERMSRSHLSSTYNALTASILLRGQPYVGDRLVMTVDCPPYLGDHSFSRCIKLLKMAIMRQINSHNLQSALQCFG